MTVKDENRKGIGKLAEKRVNVSQLSSLQPYKTIDAKPKTTLYVLLVLSVSMLFVNSIRILGVITLLIEGFLFYKLKSHTLFAFYDDFFTVFQNDDQDTCQQIFWNDIDEWNVQNNSSTGGVLNCVLVDKSALQVRTLSSIAVFSQFEKKAKTKESNYKRKEAMKAKNKK